MDFIYNLIFRFFELIRRWIGLILPLFSEASDFQNWPGWARWVVRIILIAGILIGLYYLSDWWLSKSKLLSNPGANQLVARNPGFYLPILAVLLGIFGWVAYWFVRSWFEGDEVEFTDILTAWTSAVSELRSKGVGLGDSPLFLIVGRPHAGEDSLFLAAQDKSINVRVPTTRDSPIRVYASRDAIFVTCVGASTWGTYTAALAGDAPARSVVESLAGGAAVDNMKTAKLDDAALGLDQALIDEMRGLLFTQSQRELTQPEQDRLREIYLLSNTQAAAARKVTLTQEVLAEGPRRLAYLCKLITRDRRPWCGVNGVLAVIPWAALETDETTKEAALVLYKDLAAAREGFRQRYPTVATISDLETAAGYSEFRRGIRPDDLPRRIGQGLPIFPDREPDKVPALIEECGLWIRQNVMASRILRYLRFDWPPEERKSSGFVPGHNRRLFLLTKEVYARGPRLARMLTRSLPCEPASGGTDPLEGLPIFGGCYVTATGRKPEEQSFVNGVLARLGEVQGYVAWSPAAVRDDSRRKSVAGVGFAILLLVAAAAIGAVVYLTYYAPPAL